MYVLQNMTQLSEAEIYQHFRRTCCFHFQAESCSQMSVHF